MPGPQHGPLVRLVPEVRTYRMGPFALADDLAHLLAVQRAGAPEAVVFYSSRILDALAADALVRLGQVPATNLFANLQLLEHLNRVATATRYWAHALRRLGNLVRHLTGRVGPEDADLAVLFAERWLEWFFRLFSHGHRLPRLTCDGQPLGLGAAGEGHVLLELLEKLEATPPGAAAPPGQGELGQHPALLNTSVLPAVLAEVLLGRHQHEEAFRVLELGLSHFPDDLRLRQLMGLHWSRNGELEEALRWLEPLHARFKDDEETAGITAGVYKRRWLRDRDNRADLEKSHRAYRGAWKSSRKKSVYAAINAAATALWLGREGDARQLAGEVVEQLHRRAASLPADLRDVRQPFSYWDQVTLAEAQLLLGDWSAARQAYREAFARHATRLGDIKVTRDQLAEHLEALGGRDKVDAFLGPGPPP
ncbi:MAG TPA: tetratricopeptide repeat-containing protein [Gemmataceae bacterium]|nr:tetratricopeptide repeat-containing protein [Gemmataceae bacterium]